MNYQIGNAGRVIVARFEDKEDILEGIIRIARKENLRSAVFHLIGGIRQGRVVVGPEREELPPQPVWKEIKESHEVLGTGTIFWEENEPKIHFHGAFGKKDMIKVGCLRGNSETFLVLEVIIIEITGIEARREFDPVSGLTLLKV
jgi:predicted DNA-binding protein with PD1-like motif